MDTILAAIHRLFKVGRLPFAPVVPWLALITLIEPHYSRSRRVGRPPIGVPRMLLMYFLQQWCRPER